MSAWQPIETAPKDGTVILVCSGPRYSAAAAWLPDGDWPDHPWLVFEPGTDGNLNRMRADKYGPPAWMPLPEASHQPLPAPPGGEG